MSNQTLLAQGWACGRWTRFCCSWQTRNLGMQKSSFICSTCETKKPMETRETQAPAPELLGELEKIKQAALDKANGKDTHVFICFYVWISYDMFLLHFFMLHVHQHTCTVVWEPYDVARITHTHTHLFAGPFGSPWGTAQAAEKGKGKWAWGCQCEHECMQFWW